MKGLVIRMAFGSWVLCDGKCYNGEPKEGEIYIGQIVAWFDSYDEALNAKRIADEAYGK